MPSSTNSLDDLRNRVEHIVRRVGFIPQESNEYFLRQVPYWSSIMDEIDNKHKGGFFSFVDENFPSDFFSSVEVPIPSLDQKLVGVNVSNRGKVFELSKPGTQKTIAGLSAIVPIEEKLRSEGSEGLKTFVTCPTYIIPNWVKEAEKLFVDPNIVVVTRDNREKSIERASERDTDLVIVGYDMTFRKSVNGNGTLRTPREGSSDDYFRIFSQIGSKSAAMNYISENLGRESAKLIAEKDLALPGLITYIVDQEAKARIEEDAGIVIEALRRKAFNGSDYYTIVDEFHNIVGENSKRAKAIEDIVKPARWADLISGTGIGNTPEGLAWAANVLGFVDDPRDFRRFISGDQPIKRIKSFIDTYAIKPIRKLKDVDPKVNEPIVETKTYDINPAEIELFGALVEANNFRGDEKYRLFRYLVSNPHKLLPESQAHLNNGDDPLSGRLQDFFDQRPGLEDRVRESGRSRMEFTRKLVGEVKEMGEKCLVACHYQAGVTEQLEDMLKDLGVRRVDQNVSPSLKEVRLTSAQIAALKKRRERDGNPDIFRGDEVFSSDLSPQAKKAFGIKSFELYGMSDREIVMNEFATDPDICALVTTRILKEGVELKEARYIIEFGDTTVPSDREQFIGRSNRSGQHLQTYVWEVRSPLLDLVEGYIEGQRVHKEAVNNSVFNDNEGVDSIDLAKWSKGITEDRLAVKAFQDLNVREILSDHFNNLEGAGSEDYSRALLTSNNALFIAGLYNSNWGKTYSGNVAKLTRDVILALETRKGANLERIVEAGSGPLVVSRMLGRKTASIDMNRYQIEHGIDACEELGIEVGDLYLGDVQDLEELILLGDTSEKVFEPGKAYPKTRGIEDNSRDLVVSSLVLDLLDKEGRLNFLGEAHRVLEEDGYLITVLPSKKVDPSCREQLIKDMKTCGFNNVMYDEDTTFTGTYLGCNDDGAKNNKNLEAYVIVSQKGEIPLFAEEPELTLRPSYKIVDAKRRMGPKRRRRRSNVPLDAEYFVRVEGGELDLYNVSLDPGDYNGGIKELSDGADNDLLGKILEDIKRITSDENAELIDGQNSVIGRFSGLEVNLVNDVFGDLGGDVRRVKLSELDQRGNYHWVLQNKKGLGIGYGCGNSSPIDAIERYDRMEDDVLSGGFNIFASLSDEPQTGGGGTE